MSLKAGQKVKCISVNVSGSKFQLEIGKKYTIKKVMTKQNQEVVTLKENKVDERYFFASRFEVEKDNSEETKTEEIENTEESIEDSKE